MRANRIAILISGRGSNMASILERRSSIDADFVGVLSSDAKAPGLETARSFGVPTAVVDPRVWPVRDQYDDALAEQLDTWGANLIVLAGFMRILTDGFVERYQGRILNIHPSLLPAFAGLHPQRKAIRAGVKLSGCTVHFVAPGPVDSGPIAAQAAVAVFAGDNEETLAARILEQEHQLFVATLRRIVNGELELVNDRVVERATR